MLTRFLYYFFSIIFLLSMVAFAGHLIFPDRSEEFWWDARRAAHEFWYGKDLHFAGLSVLQSEDIEVRLPMEASVLWWNLASAEIEGKIRAHPLVEEAYLQHCSKFAWRCFDVIIVERKPRYLIQLGDKEWAVGEDGGFITPTPGASDLPGTIRILGLGGSDTSPDAVKYKFAVLRKAIATIQSLSGVVVNTVRLEENLEFIVESSGLTFPVKFDLAKEGEAIASEALRLKKLLREFGGRLEVIKSIDLSYNKMAVIQVNQQNQETTSEPAVK